MANVVNRLRRHARRLKSEANALRLACRDPRVPRPARWLVTGAIAYALSPVDLIPDFIPVIGLLDDLLLVPLALGLALRMIPPEVRAEYREKVREDEQEH